MTPNNQETQMKRIGHAIELVISQSRWLIVPFLLGLVIGLGALAYTFVLKLAAFLSLVGSASEDVLIVGILKLVDLSLTANLLLIVIGAGYMNYVTRVDPSEHSKWPPGILGIGFSDLKQKLLGSIIAIAAVNVLEWFMDIDRSVDSIKLGWVVGILLAFAVAMLLLAIADRVGNSHKPE